MELYSTVLWHMKREVDLSHLAQQAVALDRHDPRAWIIMGNCFSLQKVSPADLFKSLESPLALLQQWATAAPCRTCCQLACPGLESPWSCSSTSRALQHVVRLQNQDSGAVPGVGAGLS